MKLGHYILENGKPVLVDLMTWAQWLEGPERHIAKWECDGVLVSTIFLGIDHNYGFGPPLLWETMVLGGKHAGYQQRYSSHLAALAGHDQVEAMVKNDL